MAIAASMIWRVRPGGASTNGAGYDGTTYPGGTDYSQQNAAQASGSLGTAAGTTTFTDAGAVFTAQMVGNALQIASGAGFTAGWYAVAAFSSSTSITLDRSPGTGSAAVWKIGGAAGGSTAHPFELARSGSGPAVPGNTIYVLGSSATPSSPDYSFANTPLNPQTAGNATAGPIKFVVDPSQPTWRPFISNSGGDLIIANGNQGAYFDGMIFRCTSAANGRLFDCQQDWAFRNCSFNLNDIDTTVAQFSSPTIFLNCEFFSKTASAPTARTTAVILNTNTVGIMLSGCYFHDCGGPCVAVGRSITTVDCAFNNNVKPSFLLNASGGTFNMSLIRGNTINGKTSGGDDGVQITTGEALAGVMFLDNIISNHATAGKAGVNVSGTLATNDRIKVMMDFNDYFNNTTNCTGFTIGANDLTLDPQYTSSSDLTLNGTNLVAQAYPRGPICGG